MQVTMAAALSNTAMVMVIIGNARSRVAAAHDPAVIAVALGTMKVAVAAALLITMVAVVMVVIVIPFVILKATTAATEGTHE
jgi:hypothetical protein